MLNARIVRLVSMTSVVAWAAPALAQSVQAGAGPRDEVKLEEIVVTAQKRSERLQNVPIAISAITGESLERRRIQTTQDLQFTVPSLVYNLQGGYALAFLRGVGSELAIPNAESSVATYVDGAYVSDSQGTVASLLGVERIEVLAGPQGTLWGRNAVGGAINTITLTPTQTTRITGKATYGNYDRREVSGSVSGGLADNLAIGIYFAHMRRDTFMKRQVPTFPTGVQPDREMSKGFRVKAVYIPTDWLTLTGTYEQTRQRSFENDAFRQTRPHGAGEVVGGVQDPIGKYIISNDAAAFANVDQEYATLREEIDLGWARILGISNWRNMKARTQIDIDGSSAPLIKVGTPASLSEQWSQELQLISPDESPVKWVVGLYYFDQDAGYDPVHQKSDAGLLGPGIEQVDNYAFVDTRSYAVFGQATVPLTSRVNLTVGARYSKDRKKFHAHDVYYAPGSADNCDAEWADPSCGILAMPNLVHPNSRKTWDNFSPKITVDYKIGGTLLYATFSTAYKSGAYNIGTPGNPGPVDPEKLTAYEAGSKSDFLDGRLRINTAGYFYKFKDLQVQTTAFGSATGTTTLLNAAKAEMYGFELNGELAVTRELVLNGGLSLEHTKYTRFPNFAATVPGSTTDIGDVNVTIDATGNRLPRAPRHVITAGAVYQTQIAGGDFIANVNLYRNGGYFWHPSNVERQKAYTLVNASVEYEIPRTPVSISLWANNLTNTHYVNTNLPLAFFGTLQIDAPPRMYGVTLKFDISR
ncbi:iron complex outermembrane recepter protein [Sphingobium faniae]|nr:iron complex outermembrane recepter protein [Sphingobium faniae]